jgi:hypothetical protein
MPTPPTKDQKPEPKPPATDRGPRAQPGMALLQGDFAQALLSVIPTAVEGSWQHQLRSSA